MPILSKLAQVMNPKDKEVIPKVKELIKEVEERKNTQKYRGIN